MVVSLVSSFCKGGAIHTILGADVDMVIGYMMEGKDDKLCCR
jgi:hypothetical protein